MKSMFVLAGFLGACGNASPTMDVARAQVVARPDVASGDSADTSCQVVLRAAFVVGTPTPCASGTCWSQVEGTFDVATSAASDTPYVLYESASDGAWRQASATPIWGAGLGYRRYQFTLAQNTAVVGAAAQTIHLIPFVTTVSGARVFDHNRLADPSAAYAVSPDVAIVQDGSCAAATPSAVAVLDYSIGWQNSLSGALVQNGKLEVAYDINRIPSGLSCTTDGVRAFAVSAFVQFAPSGVQRTERIDGPADPTTQKLTSLPLDFDIPADATSAALWFLDSSDCDGNEWDSQFGANYNYAIATQ